MTFEGLTLNKKPASEPDREMTIEEAVVELMESIEKTLGEQLQCARATSEAAAQTAKHVGEIRNLIAVMLVFMLGMIVIAAFLAAP